VWIQARLYEKQIGLVNVGDAVEAVVDAYPGRTFKGTVAFIDPTLDANTRTVGVRYDLENSDGSLRPGMFATVWIDAPLSRAPAVRDHLAKRPAVPDLFNLASLSVEQQRICLVTGDKLGSMGKPVAVEVAGKSLWACCANCEPALKKDPDRYLAKLSAPPGDAVLAVPVSAVVDTGERKIVFVETEPGVFEGRNVILGPLAGELFPVLDGLSPADKVASHGAFLLDAETRLNPAAGAVYFGKSQ
jgi:Cu(I)/Ag(I) efflux system membrane fusion protein